MNDLACSKDSLCQKLKETSEKLIELERERELSGGQFVPSDRDYYCSPSTDNSVSEMIDEAIRGERSKFNCEFLCLGCLIPVKVYLEHTKVHFIQILITNA